jgi:8-oxo-dGTP pyrophosphatase MutT (NUDIX family)
MTSSPGPSFIEEIREKLRAHEPRRIPPEGRPPAGVLLLLYDVDGRTHLLFTRRTDLVEHHKGQICFPGGAREEGDSDLLHTALRETCEEVGVRPEDVEPIGQLDDIVTWGSNFVISPYVGVLFGSVPYPFDHARHEVEEVLEVPLEHLLDSGNVVREVRRVGEHDVEMQSYRFGDQVIWGATARILKQLLDFLAKWGPGS